MVLLVLIATGLAAGDDLEQHRFCDSCGMDRKAYGYSRMLIRHEDGAETAACSLHCAAKALSDPARAAKTVLVADRDSRVLIDAAGATWVLGGNKRGVMTKLPKWAFQTKTAAEAFTGSNGGKLASWEEALAAARDELVREDH
jgi:nitrous oxide reductase accessory protein NosL